MDALECIATRRSIRRFLDIPVDQETIMTVIEAGALAPSSGNVQDWRFILITDKSMMRTISEYSLGQECVHNAAFLIIVIADPEMTERHYGLRGQKLYTVQNCAAAIQNMLLAAHAIGLGGVWVGAFDEEKIKMFVEAPESVRPQAILAFGYPAEVPNHKLLKDLSLTTFFNRYGNRFKNENQLFNDYSLDWQERLKAAHSAFDKIKEKAINKTKDMTKTVSQESDNWIKKYREKLKANKKK